MLYNKNFLKHIAIIMDGNGRWANKHNVSRILGHKKGLKTVYQIIDFAIRKKINILTLYAFSTENWSRPKLEVFELIRLFSLTIKNKMYELNNKNICVKIIGRKNKFHYSLRENIKKIEFLTRNNVGLKLNIAMDYGGRWDITNGIKKILLKFKKGLINLNKINENFVNKNLCLGNLPSVDLVIRTGGEKRISNFLLWQISYSELFFTDILWPDFNELDFLKILNCFYKRERRFGKI